MTDTRTQILEIAERLIRTRGYNAFSYAGIADVVGTSKAAIHHYFPSKVDLGSALLDQTEQDLQAHLGCVPNTDSIAMLKHYFKLFELSILGEQVCLCGMLMAENDGLPETLRLKNKRLVDWQIRWLKDVLDRGREANELHFSGPALSEAELMYGAIQGSHIVAKMRNDVQRFQQSMKQLLGRYASLH